MTDRKQALTDLLAKVEAGTWDHDAAADWLWLLPGQIYGRAQAAFHGSLDAAKALHEAVLPGWATEISERVVGDSKRDGWNAVLTDLTGKIWTYEDGPDVGAWHPNSPARAWLIAILKALIAEDATQ